MTKEACCSLGRFRDGGHEALHAAAATLRDMNYLPIIFDFDRPDDRDYTETVKPLVDRTNELYSGHAILRDGSA